MARPFEDHMPYQQMVSQNSLASQTVLAGPEEYGSSWSAKRKLSTKRPKLPKIKSLAGASSRDADAANTDRAGHKRGSSASATPTSPTYVPDYLIQSSSSFLPTAHADPSSHNNNPTRTKSTKVKIKPLLSRTFSSQTKEQPSTIDLSRSAVDNEGLAAAISEVNIPGASVFASPKLPSRSGSISQTPRSGSAVAYHARNPSATSQKSTTTTASTRYYVHPMRQTPRAYTPPVAGSYKTSFDSDYTAVTSDLDTTTKPTPISQQRRVNLPPLTTTTPRPPQPTHTSSTNINNPPTPSSLRNPHPLNPSTPPTTTARSSLETSTSTTGFRLRSRSNTATTPTEPPRTQAETVQHLRAKFAAKEAAKDAKYREAEAKSAEKEAVKEARRRERKDSDARRAEEKRERKGTGISSRQRSRATSKATSVRSEATFGTAGEPVVGTGAGLGLGLGAGAGLGLGGIGGGVGGGGRVDGDALGREMWGGDVQQLRNQSSRGEMGRFAGGVGGGGGRSRAGTMGGGGGFGGGFGGGGGAGEKVEKVKGGWSLFWFRVRTVWLRVVRRVGGGGG